MGCPNKIHSHVWLSHGGAVISEAVQKICCEGDPFPGDSMVCLAKWPWGSF